MLEGTARKGDEDEVASRATWESCGEGDDAPESAPRPAATGAGTSANWAAEGGPVTT